MPDISMCPGGACSIKQDCYRFTATPTPERQSYFCEPPYLFEEETSNLTCQYLWLKKENKPKTKGNQMKVLICGTEQVVPDECNMTDKPWVTKVHEKKILRQGDKIWIGRTEYIVTFIPVSSGPGFDFSKGWRVFAISLCTGARYDNGHFVSYEQSPHLRFPADWENKNT